MSNESTMNDHHCPTLLEPPEKNAQKDLQKEAQKAHSTLSRTL